MVIEATKTESEIKREKNKHRLELLMLLVAVEAAYRNLFTARVNELIGAILRMADKNGRIDSSQIVRIGALIEGYVSALPSDIASAFDQSVAVAAHIGVDAAGGGANEYRIGQQAAGDLVRDGVLGVPFQNIATAAVVAYYNNLLGAISRAAFAESSVKFAQDEIDKATESLTSKVASEAQMHLNAAFVASTRATAGALNITELRWRLSPYVDRHCRVCSARDGNVYSVDDKIWDEIPVHNHCQCWGEPVE